MQASPLRAGLVLFALGMAYRSIDIVGLRLDETSLKHLPSKLLGIFSCLVYLRMQRLGVREAGLVARGAGRAILLGTLLSLTVGLAAYGAPLYVLRGASVPITLGAGAASTLTAAGIVLLLVFHLGNGLLEEGLFRGILLRQLMTRTSPARANFQQSMLFGLWHIVWPLKWWIYGDGGFTRFLTDFLGYAGATFVSGIIFGYLFLRTGNLWVVVMLHAVSGIWNELFGLLEVPTHGALGASGGTMVLLVPVLFVIAFHLMDSRRTARVAPWGAPAARPDAP